jgi:magnesium-transporting ATPase (P-type)
LQGECLVDEATLTGESTPVPKIKSLYNDFNKKNILFDGTTILQVTYSDDQGVPCLVIRTGTNYKDI